MRSLLHAILSRFVTMGRLTVRFPDGRIAAYGPGGAPSAGATIVDWPTVRGLLTNPALVFGEAYVSGSLQPLDCKLEDILDLLFANLEAGRVGTLASLCAAPLPARCARPRSTTRFPPRAATSLTTTT